MTHRAECHDAFRYVHAEVRAVVQVVAPTAGGPASRAGIRAQEQLLAIDSVKTAGLSLYDIGARLQGPSGSTVVLSLQAKGSSASRDVQLTRCGCPDARKRWPALSGCKWGTTCPERCCVVDACSIDATTI